MIALKIDRALFALIMGVVTVTSGYLVALVDYFAPGPIGTASVVFIMGIAAVIIVYLSTEQQTLPPAPIAP